MLPTDPSCETRFSYSRLGEIAASHAGDVDVQETIRVLNLQNDTLIGWRLQAIDTFIEVIASREDAELIIQKTTVPENGRLPEYCFAIRQAAQFFLDPVA